MAGITVVLSGCAATVLTGIPAAAPSAEPQLQRPSVVDPGELGALLVEPADFPDGYTAQVLEYRDAVLASDDLGGLSRGARVNPVRCQPSSSPASEESLAMISGMSAAGQSTMAEVLTRTDEAVEVTKDTISRCNEVVSDEFGVQSRINRALLAPPATGTEGEFAYSQTVTSGTGDVALTQDSITLVAQVEDVRIAVTWMTQRGAEVDRADLDLLFAAAVANVR